MMDISLGMAYHMWQRNRDVFFRLWKENLGGLLVEPLFLLVGIGFGIGSLVKPGTQGVADYAEFVAPGVVAGYAMFHAAGECAWGTFLRMVNQRIFQGILATPMSVEELALGEMLWGASKGLISCVAVLATAAAFGLFRSPYALLLVPVGFLIGVQFAAITVSFTAIAPSINVVESFYTLFLSPMFFFAGVFFPISGMPHAVQPFLWLLPLTPGVHLMQLLAVGQFTWAALGSLALVMLWTALFLPLALRLMRRRLVK